MLVLLLVHSQKSTNMALPTISHPQLDENLLKAKGVSLVAFFEVARKRDNESAAIKLRIVHQRYPKYYSIRIFATEDEYLKICEGGKSSEIKNKRIIIYENLKKAYDIIVSMQLFNFDEFERKFKTNHKSNNIFGYLDGYIEQLKNENRLGSVTTYTNAKNKLKEFYNKERLPFESVNVSFLKQFEKWMIDQGGSPTSVGFHCRSYRKMFNDAILDGIIQQSVYPFGNKIKGLYQPPQPRNIKKAINLTDIKKIVEYQPEPMSSEQYYRDLWIFSYLGNGINVKDMCLLQFKHIKEDSIIFNRAKTINTNRHAKPIQIALIDQNKAIIERWGNKSTNKEEYIFPEFIIGMNAVDQQRRVRQLTKQINKYMRKIVKILHLEINISTYTARHSFATVLKRSGVGIEYISESLGHSDLKVTENYLDSFEDETRVANTKKLLEF